MSDILQRSPYTRGILPPVKRAAARLGGGLIDTVLPPRCLSCGAGLGSQGALCATCWSEIAFIDGPMCAACGLPFEFDEGADAVCGACLQQPPAYRHHRSVMQYNDASRSLILSFKHGDRTDAAPVFGQWLRRAASGLIREETVIVPVPLHRRRLFTRRYNQSALMAKALGRLTGTVVAPGLLRRTRHTATQGTLSRSARHKNVAGAFAVHAGHATYVKGAHFLLIDDVMTTGATIEACTKTLMRAGASSVDVLTLARVVRPRTN